MKNINDAPKISRQLLDVVEQFNHYDKQSRSFGTDHELFIAEIHLIALIAESENSCISELAKAIQVTKGAVSQMVKKLVKKGYLIKLVDSCNKTRILVLLTEKGWKAYEGHLEYHKKLDRKVFDVLQKYNGQERSAIYRFLSEMQGQWK